VELPSGRRLVEAVGVIQADGPKRGHQLYTESGATEEPGRIHVPGVGPDVPGVEEGRDGEVVVETDGGTINIDARPSDSIAIALKTGASIYVNEELFNLQTDASPETPDIPNDPESLRERLRKINPEDFGKYSL